MNIALAAINNKKRLMQNFCIAYRQILSKHTLYATGTTGRLIEEVTNLHVHKYLAGPLGGIQQMGAQISGNELDMVIFLNEPSETGEAFHQIVNLCDTHNIPIATNLATAEMLVLGMESGNLDWRNLYK
ncbi:MAG: methylglyoxal synthase [Firmicutes bacterium]|nr:methylglyoxal synthase [Bacillota bacterium]